MSEEYVFVQPLVSGLVDHGFVLRTFTRCDAMADNGLGPRVRRNWLHNSAFPLHKRRQFIWLGHFAVSALLPVLPPVAVATCVVLALNATTSLSTLQCLITGIAAFGFVGLSIQEYKYFKSAAGQLGKEISTVHSKVVLLTAAILLGKTLILAIAWTGMSAVSVAVASNMFGVSLEGPCYGPNLRFIALFGLISIICLTVLTRLLP